MHPVLLDSDYVYTLLKQHHCTTPFTLHFHNSLDSTNNFLKTLPLDDHISVCCAEMQTEGRGRFGRNWHSPEAENIYCSIRWPFEKNISQLSGLSLVIALALMKTLKISDLGIKWPNDILWKHKKIAGILIETQTSGDSVQAIIGIGININSETEKNPLPDKAWCSLRDITGTEQDRNPVLATLLIKLGQYIPLFAREGLKPFIPDWMQYDLLKGKECMVMHNNLPIEGIASGIDEYGRLLLTDPQGTIHALSSGETTLNRAYA